MLGYPYGWLITIVAVALLVVMVCAAPLKIRGEITRTGNNDEIELALRALFGLIYYKWHIPLMKLTDSGLAVEHQSAKSDVANKSRHSASSKLEAHHITGLIARIKDMLEQTENLTETTLQTFQKLQITKWKWHTIVGVDDAMWTAMLISMVWSLKTTSIGVISQIVKLSATPDLSVKPNYSRAQFSTEWFCIAQIRFGYAILAGLKLYICIKKSKGGVKLWQNILFRA